MARLRISSFTDLRGNPLLGGFPVLEMRLALGDQLFPAVEQILVPLRGGDLGFVAAQVAPEQFERMQLFRHGHLRQWKFHGHADKLTERFQIATGGA